MNKPFSIAGLNNVTFNIVLIAFNLVKIHFNDVEGKHYCRVTSTESQRTVIVTLLLGNENGSSVNLISNTEPFIKMDSATYTCTMYCGRFRISCCAAVDYSQRSITTIPLITNVT